MPAVTVDETGGLPTVGTLDPASTRGRPVVSVTTAPAGFEGEGFPVRRAFAGVDRSYLDPFVHMDQMGEVEYAPGEPKGTPWHPHRGFETVTYMIDGTFRHRDSIGGGGLITDGDTQWMTAGSGILHIEAPPEELVVSGGLFHGIQLWVNLPRSAKMIDPAYQDSRSGDVVLLTTPDGGALLRLIAGSLGGHAGPGSTLADDHGARHVGRRRLRDPPLGPDLQRAGLRPLRRRHGRRGAATGHQRTTGRLRAGRLADRIGLDDCVGPHAGARRVDARRQADR